MYAKPGTLKLIGMKSISYIDLISDFDDWDFDEKFWGNFVIFAKIKNHFGWK